MEREDSLSRFCMVHVYDSFPLPRVALDKVEDYGDLSTGAVGLVVLQPLHSCAVTPGGLGLEQNM